MDKLSRILDRAWMLSDKEMQGITPGYNIADIESLLDLSVSDIHPFKIMTREDKENPHVHLLRIMRNPDYFPFTCKLLFDIEIMPFQHLILKELWTRPFPMIVAGRGSGKSFILGLYAMLRLLFTQGCKIAIVGAAFRQAKVIFEYMENLWVTGSIYRDLCGTHRGKNNREQGPSRSVDRFDMVVGESVGFALPLGNGDKIRGQRANYTIADEFASIREDIYQNVVRGFSSVSASPAQNVKDHARIRLMKSLGLWTEDNDKEESRVLRANQNIISGTAYYSFNHFYRNWVSFKSIIQSGGDVKKLEEFFQGPIPDGFNWRDYSIVRLPVELLPLGFMDQKQISSAKATSTKANYMIEYGASFATDSEGFFKRSLVESCVVGKVGTTLGDVSFSASLSGEPDIEHVMAIDPASERDNFSVIILALHQNTRRIVYCWTTNRASHREKVKRGITKDLNFYSYCARKIRDLSKLFPCKSIVIDSQGGGISIEESLHDDSKLKSGEVPFWRTIDPDPKKRKDSDDKPGEHNLAMINFADGKWVIEANHGLRKDMEDKVLLFPFFDSVSVGLAFEDDREKGRIIYDPSAGKDIQLYDTLEDCVMEIEELKDELSSIVHTLTNGGRDRWDTPDFKGGIKNSSERVRKDRYSSLLMANMISRQIQRTEVQEEYKSVGGFSNSLMRKSTGRPLYSAPEWFSQGIKNRESYGEVVKRDSV